jgi:hypothetical protein
MGKDSIRLRCCAARARVEVDRSVACIVLHSSVSRSWLIECEQTYLEKTSNASATTWSLLMYALPPVMLSEWKGPA